MGQVEPGIYMVLGNSQVIAVDSSIHPKTGLQLVGVALAARRTGRRAVQVRCSPVQLWDRLLAAAAAAVGCSASACRAELRSAPVPVPPRVLYGRTRTRKEAEAHGRNGGRKATVKRLRPESV